MSTEFQTVAKRKAEFLELQREHKTITLACREIGFPRSTVSRWRKEDKQFRRLHDRILAGQSTEQPDLQPVSITEFVTNPRYLGKSGIRPVVLNALTDIYSGDFHTVLLGGSIGWGKTFALQLAFCYELYRLSTMPNPHAEFGLDSDSTIAAVIQNRTERLAKDNDFATVKNMLAKSPYFQRCYAPIKRPTADRIHFPNNVSVFAESGDFRAVLGLNAYISFLDETDFMTVSDNSIKSVDGVYDQAKSMYDTARSRQQSRFYLHGQQRSKILIASSAHYTGAFSSTVEAEAKRDDGIFVRKYAIWDARPEHYSPETFAVFVGDATRDPRIIGGDEETDPKDRHLIIQAPIDFLSNARRDVYKFLMDDAGIAVQPASTFFSDKDTLAKAFRILSVLSRQSIVSGELVGFASESLLNPGKARFCHLDLSKTKDSTGLAFGHIDSFREINGEIHPFIVIDAVLQIKPPMHGEINYALIRNLLYRLRHYLPIVRVTADQALSADLLQVLALNGFQVGLQSLDRDTRPYQCLKDAIADSRLALPRHDVLLKELTDLQIDWKRGKIDHPVNGSKDCADAVAGVVFQLTQDKRLRIESGQVDRLMPRLGSVVTAIQGPYMRNELDQYGVDADPFVRAMNRLN